MHFTLAERALYGLPQSVIALFIVLALIGSHFFGIWARRFRDKKRGSDEEESHEGFVVSAVMGLLALLLGFTFSMAINEYNERRELVVQEATAIHSAYLASQELPEPDRGRMAALLIDYTELRLAAATSGNVERALSLVRASEQIQSRLWAIASEASQERPNHLAVMRIVDSVDHMVAIGDARVASRMPSVPVAIHGVLLMFIMIGAVVQAFAFVGDARRATMVLLLLFTLVQVTIIDVEQPTHGFIVQSQKPMEIVLRRLQGTPPAAYETSGPAQVESD